MKKRIFVTGGSGFLGQKLLKMLKSKGHITIIALARSEKAAQVVREAGADEIALADLGEFELLKKDLIGVDAVIHAAAHFKMWDSREAFYHTNVEGTQTLIDAAKAAGVKKFVYISAAATIMGEPKPMFNLEEKNSEIKPLSWAPYIETKALAEQMVLKASDEKFKTVIIRPPLIWGADAPMIHEIFHKVKDGQFALVDRGAYNFSAAHVTNVCHAAILASESDSSHGAYFVTDGKDYEFRSFFESLLRTQGLPLPSRSVPFRIAWRLAPIIELIWKFLRVKTDPPITKQMIRLIGKPFTLSISKAKRDFGYQPLVHFEQGLSEFKKMEETGI